MDLWRISNHADLSGRGGQRAAGRWHSAGRPIVYCAEHPALALLEVLVHLEIGSLDDLPRRFQLLRITVPDRLRREVLARDALPARWTTEPSATRAIGDAWLRDGASALLAVPSVLLPYATNWLVNPAHDDHAFLVVSERIRYPFDARLVKSR